MNTKVIAFYLPQFHENSDNNRWWGKGFTEWTCIKDAINSGKAKKNPKIPLNNNYYDLTEKENVQWQTDLAKQYGIYGFAYYHYWIEGKKLLNIPAENLLEWKDIDQKFFFFWANHSWYKAEKGKKKLLIEQTYGGYEDWKKHYSYMRPFFADNRYIKVSNKPTIGIFRAKEVIDYEKMIEYWNECAVADGFDGIYIIESHNRISDVQISDESIVLKRQPDLAKELYRKNIFRFLLFALSELLKKIGIPTLFKYSYSKIAYLERATAERNSNVMYSISTGWNNTPRHGKYGQVFSQFKIEEFKKTFEKIFKLSNDNQNEFLFINAWNEWAEGMVLEPDYIQKYRLLETISEVIENSIKHQ